ncbi:hypothetical protein SAMN04487934_11010 [Eubacterium ruminantium]|nr:hypothetical protein SAMN04487934_11010 [Eubacterium ruminantium]
MLNRVRKNETLMRLLVAVGINMGVLIGFYLMFHASEKTDDLIMKFILSGSMSGKVDEHILYSNYALGLVLSVFQKLIPGIAWYEVFQYMVIFASLTAFTYLMYKPKKPLFNNVVILAVLLYFGFECYIKLTFTKSAGLAMGVGLLLIMHGFRRKKLNKRALITGGIILLMGVLLRGKMFNAIFPLFFGIPLVEMFLGRKDKPLVKRKLIQLGVLAGVFVVIFIIKLGSNVLFSMDKEWADYRKYNNAKVELQDYGWPEYYEHEMEYTALGISRNDYKMWTNRDYGDPDRLTVDVWENVAKLKDPVNLSTYINGIREFFQVYPLSFFDIKVIPVIIVLIFLFLASDEKSLKKAVPLIFMTCVVLAEYFYLYINGRYNSHHVDTAIFACVAMYMCYFIYELNVKRYQLMISSALIVVLLFNTIKTDKQYMTRETYTGKDFLIEESAARDVVYELTHDKDSLYVMCNDEYYGLYRAYGVFEVPEKSSLDNVFCLSAYMYPYSTAALEKRNITNIFNNICDDNVYFVTSSGDGKLKVILKYVQEHYYPSADYKEVRKLNGATIYKIYK